ncbi:MAG: bifunctional oligoribonuclease/PAP phosphatase NrnA [Dethiobacter sp.]|nr:bifunctional oligoribonuclease/PAP phosphatase NrnA [Dethiobacter sp.]MBS3897935.1 bifunctional oligoribonuclease/PAP phosphatase NrnA [Dethiobacter sp.]MBS3983683.1 bifunctional oligoribonuclease/PAP phosphatase NrnA [Dethiobacter sp.]MCL4462964.1 bifunctional oligoribonuclease/PAP phosphatase NrnA [Bacillota bacterium]MCL5993199.1 bifunctional oligoribonuclease/PAP phosphatase NrnA [Bacillota bacterium]
MNRLAEIAVRLKSSSNILVTSHIMPDGDSIGSLLGLGLALQQAGHAVTMFSVDGVPDRYSFLDGSEKIVEKLPPKVDYDCVVILDCSDQDRIKPIWEQVKELLIINIDHHPTNHFFGNLNYVNPDASATGEIVYQLLLEMAIPVDERVSAALYVAISTDTGSFKFENTTPAAHEVAARLLEAGVKLREITPRVFDLRSRTAICILREALNTLRYSEDGSVAWITLTEKEMISCGARDEDLDGVVNYAKNIEGVEVGLIFREKSDGVVKVGFRAHSIDVSKLAETLGGGGHARAAGCFLEMSIKEAVEKVLDLVVKEVENGRNHQSFEASRDDVPRCC